MAGEKNPTKDKNASDTPEETKKRWKRSALIFAGVILLSSILPSDYKGFAPLLFLLPVIISVMDKIQQTDKTSEHPARNQLYSAPTPEQTTSHEPYSYKPRNPKDPRKYKPIG